MKRTVVALTALAAVYAAAFQPPARTPLPNFDRRADRAPAVAPQQAEAVAALQVRVPQLQVAHHRVLQAPEFFSSSAGFLSGPDGEGLAVSAASARAFSKDDPHRAIKAFLN